MAIGCGPKCAKWILILFNLVFWLSGLIMIVVAAMVMSHTTLKYIDNFENSFQSKHLLIGLLIVGIIIFVIAFCGCCGAIKESKMLLGIYIFFLVLIIIVQIAIGISAIVFKKKVETSLTEKFNYQFTKQYGNDSDITDMIDELQKNLLCCGATNKDDWTDSYYSSKNKQRYPSSCCKTANSTCLFENINDVHESGCREKLEGFLTKFSPIIIGVVLGIAFFEIFVVICAFCLCRNRGTLSETV